MNTAAIRYESDAAWSSSAPGERRWAVIQTEHRQEQLAAKCLRREGYDVTLLLRERQVFKRGTSSRQRSTEIVERPMLPQYLFWSLPWPFPSWARIFSVMGVRGIICSGEVPAFVPDAAMAIFMRETKGRGAFERVTSAPAELLFKLGDAVEIQRGAFVNHVGKVGEVDESGAFGILFQLLGRPVTVKFPADQLRRVD